MKTLAVYGTLKKGYPLESWLCDAKFQRDDSVSGSLYISPGGGIPFLGKGVDKVHVEVYNVDEDTFSAVKHMEEAAGYKTTLTRLKSGQEAYVFFYPHISKHFKRINKF